MSFTSVTIRDCTLYHGDCLEVLPTLGRVDAVVTDPPYSSGGQFRGDRTRATSFKYVQTSSEETCRDEFAGDTRDQRAFLVWASMWMAASFAIAQPGAVCCVFTDWRQLPTMTDAIQCGGWIWRNIVTWWKRGCRMQRGRFSSSAEYCVYGSKGVPLCGEMSPQNVLVVNAVGGEEKEHIAEKPVELLEEILGVTQIGAVVLDPFMGSGTTGVACVRTGRKFIGIEIEKRYFDIAVRRIREAYEQTALFDGTVAPVTQLELSGVTP